MFPLITLNTFGTKFLPKKNRISGSVTGKNIFFKNIKDFEKRWESNIIIRIMCGHVKGIKPCYSMKQLTLSDDDSKNG